MTHVWRMIKKLVCIGLLAIVVVFLIGCVQEKAFIKPAETINQSTIETPTVINKPTMATPTVLPIKPNRVELGNFGYSYYDQAVRDFQNQPEISWDVILNQNGLV